MVNETQAFLYCNTIAFNGRLLIRSSYHVTKFRKQLKRKKVLGVFKHKVAIEFCVSHLKNYSGCSKHLSELVNVPVSEVLMFVSRCCFIFLKTSIFLCN